MMNHKHLIPLALTYILILSGCVHKTEPVSKKVPAEKAMVPKQEKKVIPIDTLAYQNKLHALANGDSTGLWPNHLRYYPLAGAILPFKGLWPIMATSIRKKWGYWVNIRQKKCGID